jgi:APA family basic amino acid/polyamine antiporter
MAVFVIISGFGALVGWTMICAEMPLAAANDGVFPERFKRMSSRGVPVFGIIASTVLASIAIVINYLGSSGSDAFTTLVLMSGITAAIPYAFSAMAQLKWRFMDHRELQTRRFLRDVIVAGVALVFSVLFIWYSRVPGGSFRERYSAFILAGAAMAVGIPVFRAQKKHMAEPEPVPPAP